MAPQFNGVDEFYVRLRLRAGGATPGQPGKRTATRSPLNWIARRLGTADRFSCELQSQ